MPKKIILLLVFSILVSCLFGFQLVSGLVSTDSIVVSWVTEESTPSRIVYWPAENTDDIRELEVLPGEIKAGYQFRASLTGLEPFTKYNYRVEYAGFTSNIAEFITAPESDDASFVFLAYGDTQHANTHAQLAEKMATEIDPVLTLHVGDLNQWAFRNSWKKFFKSAAPLLERAPIYPVYGNHELFSPALTEYFELPNNEIWYGFDFGPVHFIALDTNRPYWDNSPQAIWLRTELERSSDSVWKIVFFHHPPFSSNEGDRNFTVETSLVPLFKEFGVNLVLSGHTHVYDHYQVGNTHYVITGGGGGNIITGGNNSYNAPFHYLRIRVSKEKLTVTAIRLDGSIADSFLIER